MPYRHLGATFARSVIYTKRFLSSFCLSTLLPMFGIGKGMPIDILMVIPMGMLLRQIKVLSGEER